MVAAVTTSLGPGAGAFLRWQTALAPMHDVGLPPGADPDAFRAEGLTYALPHGFVTRVQASAQTLHRSPERAAERDLARADLILLLAGTVTGEHDGRQTEQRPGDLLLIDYRRPFSVTTTAFSTIGLSLTRERLPLPLRSGADHGAILPAGSPGAALLARHATALLEALPDLSIAEAEAAMDGIFALTAASLARQRAATPEPAAALHDRALTALRASLADPALSPALLAERLEMSRAALYQAFRDKGGVMATLLRLRLEEAARILLEGSGQQSIAEIAYRCGFTSEAHFSRAFRARFGRPPRNLWREGQSGSGAARQTDWLAAKHRDPAADPFAFWVKRHTHD